MQLGGKKKAIFLLCNLVFFMKKMLPYLENQRKTGRFMWALDYI